MGHRGNERRASAARAKVRTRERLEAERRVKFVTGDRVAAALATLNKVDLDAENIYLTPDRAWSIRTLIRHACKCDLPPMAECEFPHCAAGPAS